MNQNKKYAEVWWETEDLKIYDISEEKKEHILALIEEDISDKMIEAGWNVIYDYMNQNNYKTKEEKKD